MIQRPVPTPKAREAAFRRICLSRQGTTSAQRRGTQAPESSANENVRRREVQKFAGEVLGADGLADQETLEFVAALFFEEA